MRLKLTQKWKAQLRRIKGRGFVMPNNTDFICNHKESDVDGNVTLNKDYCAKFDEEMIVDDEHYAKCNDLQEHVKRGYLEII